jgi:hypothetical protein
MDKEIAKMGGKIASTALKEYRFGRSNKSTLLMTGTLRDRAAGLILQNYKDDEQGFNRLCDMVKMGIRMPKELK